MRLTDRSIAALPSPDRGQKLYVDDTIQGFGIRVSQGGTKTFVLTYGEQRRRVTIGRYPVVSLAAARDKAKRILARRQLGLDQPQTPRLETVQIEFLASRESKLRASSYRKDRSRLKLFAPLYRKRLADITPEEVQELLDSHPAASTRHEAFVRFGLLMRFAIKRRYIQNWPLDALDITIRRVPRERVLDNAELAKVVSTARLWRLAGHNFGTIVELLVLTGQRRGQIGSLDCSMVDFDNNLITWPPELMKAGRKHTIPMGKAVRALLEPYLVNGLYFPNKYGEPFTFASAHDRAFRADCGFSDWVLHDLRRTVATRWQEMGIDIVTTERMLSHRVITGGLIGVYQRHNFVREMRAAVERWEQFLAGFLNAERDPLS